MTAQKSLRKKFTSALATGTAVLLAASGLALAPTSASAEPNPQITLSKSVLDPAGDTLTVTGTGFDASYKGIQAYYGCADPTNAPKGFYLQIGWIKDTWKPSTYVPASDGNPASGGINNTDRKGNISGLNNWYADGELNCQAPATWTLEEGGTVGFSQTFEVSQEAIGVLPEGARYAAYVHGGAATATNPSTQQAVNEVATEFIFHPASATTAVTKADNSGLTVDVSATNFPAGVSDAYGAIIERGTEDQLVGQGADYVAFVGSPFVQVSNGAAQFSLLAPKAKLDRSKEYSVILWKKHDNATPENIYAIKDIEVTEAQWNAVYAVPTAAKVTFSSAMYNKSSKATVTVSPASGTAVPTGAVKLSVAGKSYSGNLSNGKASFTLNKLAGAKKHTATVSYTSNSPAQFASSSVKATLTVKKATPKVLTKLVKSKVKANKNPQIRVTVKIPGSLKAKASKYKVVVYDGKKKIKTQKLNSSGKATVKLKKLKAGKHKIKVKVLTSKNAKAKTSASKTLRVVR